MKSLIERAHAGNRQAVMELYEKYRNGAVAICCAGYDDTETAHAAVVQAFENTWGYLLSHCVKSEEEFVTTLYKQAAILCRKNYTKKGMKGLPIPQNKNFVAAKWKEDCTKEKTVLENLLAMQPGINRYIFVLHQIAGFDEKMIGSITGYKNDVVEAALTAEEQNIDRALEQLNKDTGMTGDLKNELQQYRENVQLSEKYHHQIVAYIDALVKPYEKKKMFRGIGVALGAVATVLIVCVIWAAATNKNTQEYTFATDTAKTSSDDTQASEKEMVESAAEEVGLAQEQTYYADIIIEDYGTITVQLDAETAPITVENFVSLAEDGFYDGLTFHRIMEGFMMQGGDPEGNGSGGSGKNIVGEFSDNGYDNDLSHTRGAISMARATAYDSASSQFFIVHEDSTFLDGQYAVFGYVTEGIEIVDAVCTEAEPTDDNGTIPAENQPVITSIDIRIEREE